MRSFIPSEKTTAFMPRIKRILSEEERTTAFRPWESITTHWPVAALTIVVFAFFARLFFPPSIFINPDYGRSDLLHFNIPVKTILADSLKRGELPLWEPKIGQGFPIFDEGQIGTFYLPNLLLFGLLPFWLAFNIGYIVTFMLSGLGTYLLARSLGLSKTSSYLAAITYTFSPIFALHIHHYNLIQAAALVPWFFWLINSFFEKKRLAPLAALPIFLSQQIFIGFPQITFYTLFALIIFFIFKLQGKARSLRTKMRITSIVIFFMALGLLIASPQIFATYRLTDQAKRFEQVNIQSLLTDFPLKPKNFATILDPFILGKPQVGTYPLWQKGTWSIFWESNLYFGMIQLILIAALAVSLFLKKFKDKDSKIALHLFFLFFLFTIIALGSSGPLYPLFSIPPFSYFRVPARFLLFTFLTAGLLAGISLDKFFKKSTSLLAKLTVSTILVLATVDVFRTWYAYSLVGEKDKWRKSPDLAVGINPQERIFTLFESKIWNNTFITKGWQNRQEDFYFFRNFIGQNSNILYGLDQTFAYAGMIPRRNSIIERLITEGITTDDNKIKIAKVSQKLLNLTSTKYLLSPFEIDSVGWRQKSSDTRNDTTIYLYENLKVMPKTYVTFDYKIAATINNFSQTLEDESYDPQATTILETEPGLQTSYESASGSVFITDYNNTKVTLQANLKSAALVVLSDSFYPGWHARVDGQKAQILAANINSRATVVPKGTHQIDFFYEPEGLKFWLAVGFFSLLCSLVIFAKFRGLVLIK